VILLRHVSRLIANLVAFGVATRRSSLIIAVLIGLVFVVLASAATVAAPVVLYPFG